MLTEKVHQGCLPPWTSGNYNNQYLGRVTPLQLSMEALTSRIEFEFRLEVLVFVEGGKREKPEKNLESKVRTNNKLKPHEVVSTGIQPGSQQ